MKLIDILSAEYILTKNILPNGGAAAFIRSAIVCGEIVLAIYIAWYSIDPAKNITEWSQKVFAEEITNIAPWIAAVFGGVYVVFYARFVSQWTYLANLYNQIKFAEVQGVQNKLAFSQWKAGYIEDALDLHMATKQNVRAIIKAWGFDKDDPAVLHAFIRHANGGQQRWDELLVLISDSKKKNTKPRDSGVD